MCCGQQLQTAGMRCCRNATTAQLYNESQQCCGGQLLLLLRRGVILKKRSGGRLKQDLDKDFLNNLGLHTRTLIHVRKIAIADYQSS